MLTTQLKRISKLIAPVVRSGTGSASLAALANVPDERKAVGHGYFSGGLRAVPLPENRLYHPGLANHIREMSGGRGRTVPSPPRQLPVVIGGTGHD